MKKAEFISGDMNNVESLNKEIKKLHKQNIKEIMTLSYIFQQKNVLNNHQAEILGGLVKKLLGQIPISNKVAEGKVAEGDHLIRQGESLFLTLNKSDNWQGAFEKYARLGNSEGCLEPLTLEAKQAMVVNVRSMVDKYEES